LKREKPCRVLIVDDHEIVRTGLSLLLKSNGFEVAGIVKTGVEVIPFLQTELVDIILLDLGLPDVHGLTILTELVGVHDASVIVLSGDLDAATCDTALKMGARAVVSKSDPSAMVIKALGEVKLGRTFCTPAIEALLSNRQSQSVTLSPRQMAILHFFALGETNKEIGYRLRIAAPTVSFHLREIREKIGAQHNRKIVEKARSIGLI
jgi:DNA-binding NarL/FixJ family response regulator